MRHDEHGDGLHMTQLDGIDTSHYQTMTGAAFPALKFATHKASEGTGIDATFATFMAHYRASGIPVTGGYHFVRSSPAADQFATFKRQCTAVGGCDIYQLDWERAADGTFPPLAVFLELERLCIAEWPGRVVTYSAPWVSGFATWLARPDRSPLWLADYSSAGASNAKRLGAVLLQYTSGVMLPAFTGRVDGNTIIDQPAWERFISGSPVIVTPTPPAPVPEPAHGPFPRQLVRKGDYDMKYILQAPGRPSTVLINGAAIPAGTPDELAGFATGTYESINTTPAMFDKTIAAYAAPTASA